MSDPIAFFQKVSGLDTSRRTLLKGGAAALLGMLATPALSSRVGSTPSEVDYVVVGSGAGGAPVAARLAENGYRVLLLEAGPPAGDPRYYDTPVLWPRASADPRISWDFYVRHYSERARHGSQFVPEKDGVLYPRAATLGGCTAHHALFTVYPEHQDWADIQELTGDPGWRPDIMWQYYDLVRTWQPITQPLPVRGIADAQLLAYVNAALAEDRHLPPGRRRITTDPNSRLDVDHSAQGYYLAPLAQADGRRIGPRERLLAVAASAPLTIATNALFERVRFEKTPGGVPRAVAVDYLQGGADDYLYAASPGYRPRTPAERATLRRTVRVKREVILSGGAINSPQMLMLSGIGPQGHLREHGITPVVDLPGVGTNLQDRVEAFVVTELEKEFTALAECTFGAGQDPCYDSWSRWGAPALYSTSGSPAWTRRRYSRGSGRNELVVFGLPGRFEGFRTGFDTVALGKPSNWWTWLLLRAYSPNRSGTVRLVSADPTAMPFVHKRSLDDGAGGAQDIDALVEAIGVARRISARARIKGRETVPGPGADLPEFIRREQFGHHLSCTNPMGREGDPKAVLDSNLRVRGTTGLRVVDASSFPRIPGVFLWLPIAILAEKAAADILAGR
ncbi:GMC family oxidoreductase [Austwickia chelonae]|uniref:GMC family oxidoreductase n=1 Tax=Austwickia chelonae TaxID=100225 RepID=UPI0013C2A4A9|nr:GMC family oxidoreductase [Austwickia chelonae]